MNVVILGGGAQGRVLAGMLRGRPEIRKLSVADARRIPPIQGARAIRADLASNAALARVIRSHELVCCCLPSWLGKRVWEACIRERRDLIDVSYAAQDPLRFDRPARRNGVGIVPDCGAAPGISNLLSGLALTMLGSMDRLEIYTGSIPAQGRPPGFHEVSWSLDDMVEEYLRPARIVSNGRVRSVAPFSRTKTYPWRGVGRLVAFPTDGLRTLLEFAPEVATMAEFTLRWPGHVRLMRRTPQDRANVRRALSRCPVTQGDLFLLRVEGARRGRKLRFDLVSRPSREFGGLQRAVAATCAVVARLVAGGGLKIRGVVPLESLGMTRVLAAKILKDLSKYGVRVQGFFNGHVLPAPTQSGA